MNIEDLVNGLNLDPEPLPVASLLSCSDCMKEVKDGTSGDLGFYEYNDLAVGFVDRTHLQVWCKRHRSLVAEYYIQIDDSPEGELPF